MEKKCWYVHPAVNDTKHDPIAPLPAEQGNEIECRKCKSKFETKNKFMDHYTVNHTSHIVCRDWLKNSCTRNKCWYRHSTIQSGQEKANTQPIPSSLDFPQTLPPPQPPAPVQTAPWSPPLNQTKHQTDIQTMIAQMAMKMNTMELQISESRMQMHTLQKMLANSNI